MEALYSEITDYLREAGHHLVDLQGNVKDIGINKANLTEEDIKIERALAEIVLKANPGHSIYAEEEHDNFINAQNIWVFDPISATRAFIDGRPHYASVVSHIHDGRAQFAAVYDPSADELFTAEAGKGAFLNGHPIHVSSGIATLLNNTAQSRYDNAEAVALRSVTQEFNPVRNEASFAVNYCWVADGRFDGVVSVAKDAFAEFAGALILQEAGGKLTSISGKDVRPNDRIFVGGNPAMYDELFTRANTALAA